jgi:hypothetical protein
MLGMSPLQSTRVHCGVCSTTAEQSRLCASQGERDVVNAAAPAPFSPLPLPVCYRDCGSSSQLRGSRCRKQGYNHFYCFVEFSDARCACEDGLTRIHAQVSGYLWTNSHVCLIGYTHPEGLRQVYAGSALAGLRLRTQTDVLTGDGRAAKTALAMDGLMVGDRNIKVQLAKSNPMGGSGGRGGGTSSSSRPPAAQPAAAAYTPPQYPGYPTAAYAPPPGYSPYAPPAYPGYAPMPGYPVTGYSSPYGPAHHYPAASTGVTSRCARRHLNAPRGQLLCSI